MADEQNASSRVKEDPPSDMAAPGDVVVTEVEAKHEPAPEEAGKGTDGKDEAKAAAAPTVSVGAVFRYADGFDKFLIVLGVLAGMVGGAVMPAFSLFFGEILDAFNPAESDGKFLDAVERLSLLIFLMGVLSFVASWVEMASFMASAQRQVRRIREAYVAAILRQDISWFDQEEELKLVTRITDETRDIVDALGEKAGAWVRFNFTFVTGFILGFWKGWELTLVLLTMVPAMAIAGAAMMKFMSYVKDAGATAYAGAGAVAEEYLGAVRTVKAFGGEEEVVDKYTGHLKESQKMGIKKGFIMGIGAGLTMLIMFSCYSLAFWYGSQAIASDREEVLQLFADAGCPSHPTDLSKICGPGYPSGSGFDKAHCTSLCTTKLYPCLDGTDCQTGGRVMMVFFAVIIGAMAIGQATPANTAMAGAKVAAWKVYDTLNRKPKIDSSSDEGAKPAPGTLRGAFEFKDVEFTYPSRPDAPVLRKLNLTIEAGSTVALVGTSGSGKSTIIQLVERFYDPAAGSVTVDGRPLTEYNVKAYRANLGLVSQEPVLFATTVADNIRYGAADPSAVTDDDIINAAKAANAHDFIMGFPNKYNTLVGQGGHSLSGGQKQRVAIARAMIRNPAVLLLDEATSALDSESERVVQEALDKLVKEGSKRTTIVIAHRLSTIRDADKIVVMQHGEVVEQGSHDELMANEAGEYRKLVEAQARGMLDMEGSDDEAAAAEALASSPLAARARSQSSDRARAMSLEFGGAGAPARSRSGSNADTRGARARTLSAFQSAADEDVLDEEEDPLDAVKPDYSFGRLMGMARPEWGWFGAGTFWALVNGATFPVFAILLTEVMVAMYENDTEKLRDEGAFWALMFFLMALAGLFGNLGQIMGYEVMGEGLVMRLRDTAFRAIIHKDIEYFDRDKNQTGSITTRLATEASLVRGLAGEKAGLAAQNVFTMAVGLVIAFSADWRLTLVVLGCAPIIAISGAIQMKVFTGASEDTNKELESAGAVVSESIGGIRTVAAFGLDTRISELYHERMAGPLKAAFKQAHVAGIGFGFSQLVMLGTYGLAFYVGGQWVADGTMEFGDVFRVLMSVLMSAMSLGQTSAMMPDASKATKAAEVLFRSIDHHPIVDASSEAGERGTAASSSDITFEDVHFTYPTRKSQPILKGLSLRIRAGTTVALVGKSGCGKSTLMQLLLRFYQPKSGMVKLGDRELGAYNVGWLRSQMGLVSQEPILFNGSVRDNVAYGAAKGTVVTQEMIEAACKAANAHDFIMELPDKYDTLVGTKGASMSGGQKQRIAIARAIIRKPAILLLDEATSALDNESERVVQAALDDVMATSKCTTIVIAHRLSTIQNADTIVVVDEGVVVEQGTHEELLANPDSHYTKQWNIQQRRGAAAGASATA